MEKPIKACEGRCNHYRGIWGPGMKDVPACDAGINYRDLAGTTDPGWVRKLPCTRPIGNATLDEQVACDKREMPTKEQIKAYDAWCDEHFKTVMVAMKRCQDHAGGKRGVRGEVECPALQGQASLHGCERERSSVGQVRDAGVSVMDAVVIAESNGHHWINWRKFVCCRDCGIIRRADDQNKPCRGVVSVGPRTSALSSHQLGTEK